MVRVRALKAFFKTYYLWIWYPAVSVKWNGSLITLRTSSSLNQSSDPSECGVWIGTQVGCKSFGPYFLLPLKLLELLGKPGEDFWKSFINPSLIYYCYSISKQNVLIGPSYSPTKSTKPKVSWHYDSL